MTNRTFRRRTSRTASRSIARKRNRPRLHAVLECLEDRVTPSTLTVTTLTDVVDPNDGVLSLREAIDQANADGSGDTIDFASDLTGFIENDSSMPTITADVTIQGPGAEQGLAIANNTNLFTIAAGANVTVSDLKFEEGSGVLFSSEGVLTIQNSWFDSNYAAVSLIELEADSTTTVSDSTFSDNYNGAIYIGASNITLNVSNSTFTGTQAPSNGGVITDFSPSASPARVSIVGSTFVDTTRGSDLAIEYADVTVQNSILTGGVTSLVPGTPPSLNPASSFNYFVAGTFRYTDYNLNLQYSSPPSQNGNLAGTDPLLGPLQDNGGPAPTRAPLPGSPVIDSGKLVAGVPAVDATGNPRALDLGPILNRPGSDGADIGAVELQSLPTPAVLTVNTLDSTNTRDGVLSLPEAVAVSNGTLALADLTPQERGQISGSLGYDVIQFSVQNQGGHNGDPGGITLNSPLYVGGADLIDIQGPGADKLTVESTNGAVRIETQGDSSIVISGLQVYGFSGTPALLNQSARLGIQNFVFTGNFALYPGSALENGVVVVSSGTTSAMSKVDSSTFTGNTSSTRGGAIYNEVGTVIINNSTFTGNSSGANGRSGGDGGAIYNNAGALIINNSTFTGNSSGANPGVGSGGAIYNNTGTAAISWSTIANNTATGGGGGIYNSYYAGDPLTLSLTGTIIANNTIGPAGSTVPDDVDGVIDPSSSYNLMGVPDGPLGLIDGENGNQVGTAAAPLDPMLGPLQDNGGPTQTLALLPSSPALDAGVMTPGLTTDQRGVSRPQGPAPDIGAFERVPEAGSLVVTTLDDVANIYDDKTSLREAIAYAETDPNPGAVETITFDPSLFAGDQAGTITLNSALPDLVGKITIDGPGSSRLTIARNGADGTPDFRIFTVSAGATVTLDDLTASGGYFFNDKGGGISNAGALTMTNVDVTGNHLYVGSGGGISNSGTLTMTGGAVSGNGTKSSSSSGGGISNSGTLTMTNVTVSNNSTEGYSSDGGGVFNWGYGQATLTDVTIDGNSTAGQYAYGGGLASISSGDDAVTITGGMITNNSTSGTSADGGGLYFTNSTATMTDVAIDGNSTTGNGAEGGGLSNDETLTMTGGTVSNNGTQGNSSDGGGVSNDGTLTMSNVTIANNSTQGDLSDGGGVFNWGYGQATLTDVTLDGNTTAGQYAYGGGLASISSGDDAVTLVRTTISNNNTSGASADGGGLYLGNGTATLTNLTISGNSTTGSGALGGGVRNDEATTVLWSTITGNTTADSVDGGVWSDGSLSLTGTIVAGNTGDVSGAVDPSSSYNLIGDSTGLSGISDGANGNQIGTSAAPIDPMLGPLQDNGGPTLTRELLAGSPALDAGSGASTDATDQRGVGRLTYRDVGAYQATASRLSVSEFPSPIGAGQSGSFSVTALDPFDKTDYGFQGDVRFSSTDPNAALPVDQALEDGAGTFSATLNTVGDQTITAMALNMLGVTGAQSGIQVVAVPLTPLTQVVINDGAAQRSMVTSITLDFNGVITTAPASAFTLTRVSGGSPLTVGVSVTITPVAGGKTEVVLTFTGDGLDGASLANGNYQLQIDGSQILDANGNPADVDDDGAAGGLKTVDFHRFFGDSNGDGLVDARDYAAFRAAYLSGDASAYPEFDANHDGQFTLADMQAFLADFLKRTLS